MTFLILTVKALEHISNSHSVSSLMGHFQPTPQNSCWAQCVIMMPLPVDERQHVLPSNSCGCVTATSLFMSSDLLVRLHRGVPVLAAVLRRRRLHPKRRGPGHHRGGQVDRLQVAGTHRSPCQGRRQANVQTSRVIVGWTKMFLPSSLTEFKERVGLSAGGEDP